MIFPGVVLLMALASSLAPAFVGEKHVLHPPPTRSPPSSAVSPVVQVNTAHPFVGAQHALLPPTSHPAFVSKISSESSPPLGPNRFPSPEATHKVVEPLPSPADVTDYGQYTLRVSLGRTLVLEDVFAGHKGQPAPQHVIREHTYIKGYTTTAQERAPVLDIAREVFDGSLTIELQKGDLQKVTYAITLVRLESLEEKGSREAPFQVPHLSAPIHAQGSVLLGKGSLRSIHMSPSPYVLTLSRD